MDWQQSWESMHNLQHLENKTLAIIIGTFTNISEGYYEIFMKGQYLI